jgi:hypothetical protein
MSRRIALTIVTVGALVLAATPAFAGKPGGSGSTGGSSISVVMVSDQNGDGAPNWSDELTFNVSTTAAKPYVNLRCYQAGTFVYDAWVGFYDGAWFGQTFTLSSSYWQGGAADCTARLVVWSKNGRESTITTLGVHVGA